MFFTSVWHVFVSRLLLSFWLLRSFMAIGFLMGVTTVSFALPTDLSKFFGIQKMVSLQRCFFKDTKLLLQLPRPI